MTDILAPVFRRLGLLTAALLLTSFPTLAEDQVAELRFTFWGSPFEKQAIEQAIASFNATHPKIHVTGQHSAYEAYGEKISAQLAAGTPPDVAYLDYAQAFPFADANKLLDLGPYFAKQPRESGVLETSLYHYDHGQKTLGTGLATGVILLYYNKELFDKAGVAYPPTKAADALTWDKFIELAKRLTRDRNGNDATSPKFDPQNIDVYGVSLPTQWWSYLTLIDSNDGALVSPDGTEFWLNKPAAVEVLQKFHDAIFVDHVAPRPTQNKTLPSSDILMQTGKIAMTFDGMWKVIDFSKSKLKWGIGALPYFKKPVTIVLSVPKVIFAATKYPDQAFEFYQYISNPKQVSLFKDGLWAPLEKSYFTEPELTKEWLNGHQGVYPSEAQEVIVDYSLNHAAPSPPLYWLRNIDRIMNEAVTPSLDQLWTDKVSAQAAADEAAEKAKPLLQGRW